jgi:hypothetical protein
MSISSLSDMAKLNVTGLLVAAAGIVIQIIGGIDYPVVPRDSSWLSPRVLSP